jgi:hypothetical protein
MFRFGQPQRVVGYMEQVTPLRHDIRRPDIVIVRRIRKIVKSHCYLRRVCSFVSIRLSALNFSVLTKFDNFGFFESMFGELKCN